MRSYSLSVVLLDSTVSCKGPLLRRKNMLWKKKEEISIHSLYSYTIKYVSQICAFAPYNLFRRKTQEKKSLKRTLV